VVKVTHDRQNEPVFDVEAFGVFDRTHLAVSYDPTPADLPPTMASMIADAWAAKQDECKAANAMLFNGSIVKLHDLAVRDGCLYLCAGPTDYRTYVGTHLANPHRIEEFGSENYANPIGTTATIISNDGYLLYGRRNNRVAYHAGYLHTIGGGLEQKEAGPDAQIDAFASVLRELYEELNVSADEVGEIVSLGLIRAREIHQPELVFDATVALSRDDLLARLDLSDPHQEHSAIESVLDAQDTLAPFIIAAQPIAPVAVGAILLHGRRCWGDSWYADACAQVTAGLQ